MLINGEEEWCLGDPYAGGSFKVNPFSSKGELVVTIVAVLRGQLDGRGLELIQPLSRALRQGEIHELVVTAEDGAGPGRRVDSIAYLAFFEVQRGGMAVTGDCVSWGEHSWTLVGFDLTHAPNHLNLVVQGPGRLSGEELGMRVGDRLVISGIP